MPDHLDPMIREPEELDTEVEERLRIQFESGPRRITATEILQRQGMYGHLHMINPYGFDLSRLERRLALHYLYGGDVQCLLNKAALRKGRWKSKNYGEEDD